MKILRVGSDHYVAETAAQLERYVLVLLNQRLATNEVPAKMRNIAWASCNDHDAETAYALLQQLDDVTLIPAKVL